jgi:hypothetical protein
LFKPNTRYEGEITPDGSIRQIELRPQARFVRRGGRTYLESPKKFTNEDTAAVMQEFP